jgi:lysophospholipid acyltransferase (LPLAT)-like uncharacterized protein
MSADIALIALAGSTLIRCLGYTWRIKEINPEMDQRARDHFPNVIYTIWHGRMLVNAFTHRNRNLQMLTSAHRDGEIIGQTVRRLGFGHVRGSSTRGGTGAIIALAEKIRQGLDIGITVDGPLGPRYRAKPGPVQIAKMTGAAILPVAAGSRHHKTLSTWDAFEVPYPFTRVRVHYGEPVVVPPDADSDVVEEKRFELERRINSLMEAADNALGR